MARAIRISFSSLGAAALSWIFLMHTCFAQKSNLPEEATHTSARRSIADHAALEAYGDMPLSFEPNFGQAIPSAKFVDLGNSGIVFKSSEIVFSSRGTHDPEPIRLQFLDPQSIVRVDGTDRLAGESNYLRGQRPSDWLSHIPTFATVQYTGLYAGIDVRFHGSRNQLEYDFVVSPGADPRRIKIRYEGAQLRSEANGDILIERDGIATRQHRPIAYQESRGVRTEVAVRTVVTGNNEISFLLPAYNRNLTLTIDPALDYSGELGGNGAVTAIAADPTGNVYLAGNTNGTGFDASPGAFQTVYGGNGDAFVMKLDPTGSTVLYATFLGGSNNDATNGIAIDSAGNAYLAGSTNSLDFPVTNGAFQNSLDPVICQPGGTYCSDGFFTELNASGSALIYSTYLGGSGDDTATAIAIDGSGNAYITGQAGAPDFPTTPGAFQTTFSKGAECFVSKIDPAKPGTASLIYSTFLGGPVDDGPPGGSGMGIAVDTANEAVAVGVTTSGTFATPGAFRNQNAAGFATGFVAKVNTSGSALVFATYLGGLQLGRTWDEATAVAVDLSGNSYVTGIAGSLDFPTTLGAFQTTSKAPNGTSVFVTKVNESGAALAYSTLIGGSTNGEDEFDKGFGLRIDAEGNAYVTGTTGDSDFPMTAVSLEPVCTFAIPACGSFVTVVNPTGSTLLFSTYFGADSGFPYSAALALDDSNRIYFGGSAGYGIHVVNGPPTTGNGWVARIDLSGTAPASALLPTAIQFGGVQINTTVQSTAALTNRGNAILSISNISMSGTSYSQTNDCPMSLNPAANCSITITFSPTGINDYSGQLTVTDNSFDSPHYVTASGSGGIASASLSASSLTFASQPVGTTSPPQPIQLRASGTAALTISSITTTGDFSQSNNCGQSIAEGKSCTINVVFTPTKIGSLSGALTVTDDASNSPQQVLLGGTGSPSVLGLGVPSGKSDSATVSAGSTATYTLSIGGGGLSGTATLSCSGVPSGATCTLPSSENVNANTASQFTVMVTTTARSSAAIQRRTSSFGWFWAMGLIGVVWLPMATPSRHGRRKIGLLLSVTLLTFLISCGGGSGGGGGGSMGTPAGTYNLTVTATMASTNQSQTLKLIVQ